MDEIVSEVVFTMGSSLCRNLSFQKALKEKANMGLEQVTTRVLPAPSTQIPLSFAEKGMKKDRL